MPLLTLSQIYESTNSYCYNVNVGIVVDMGTVGQVFVQWLCMGNGNEQSLRLSYKMLSLVSGVICSWRIIRRIMDSRMCTVAYL